MMLSAHSRSKKGAMYIMASILVCTLLLLLQCTVINAKDDGLALKPPLGWRSWNLYVGNVHQYELIAIMDGLVNRTRKNRYGKPTSLCDLGYCDVGLDDTWQRCGSPQAAPGMHYHDAKGNPLVNYDRFPSMKNMTDHAKKLGLTAGWYSNNCACNDHCNLTTGECEMQIRQDSKALVDYGYSSLKIDGCGNEKNLTLWDKYLVKFSPKNPILVEHCDKNDPLLGQGCPTYHFYRTSVDIRNNYASIMHNLGTIEPYRATNSSYPGCWAYADMLQVGVRHGLNLQETRSHFAGWAIVSSPLILSHDVNDDEVMDRIWDIISNDEILNVNQAYFGESGGVYEKANQTILLESDGASAISIPEYQYLSKPIGKNKIAVLLMNSANETRTLTANFTNIPYSDCAHDDNGSHCDYLVRDIWKHVSLGRFRDSWSVEVESHDAAFITLEKMGGNGNLKPNEKTKDLEQVRLGARKQSTAVS